MYANKINNLPNNPSAPRSPQITLRALALLALASGAGTLALRAHSAPAEKPNAPAKGDVMKSAAAKPLTDDEKIVHVLNRLGFGPRPGDVQKVKAMGLQAYINQQLSPETVNDSTVDQQLAAYTQLNLSDEQLMEMYQARQQAFAASRKLRKEIISENTKKDAAANPTGANPAMTPGTASGANADTAASGANPAMTDTTGADGDGKKGKAKKNILAQADPQERQEAQAARRALAQAALPVALAQKQFVDAKALRAIESERQLQEVLVDFWSNHFNIDVRKQSCGVLKIADDREVIRPHILGKFRDLLGASAHSPAMLVYLDNALSTSDTPPDMNALRAAAGGRANGAMRPGMMRRRLALMGGAGANGQAAAGQDPATVPQTPAKKKRGGLNENYGREIMELHTLGVDGGYTQADVTEAARCFTGWSIGRALPAMGAGGVAGRTNGMRPRQMLAGGKKGGVGAFQFHPLLHDNGPKMVLGHQIPANGGIQDGETVLDILASHPATMQHISTQLCQRLVSDTPPASLVDKCVATWKRTDGDLREITRTIVTSPEFYSSAAFRSKIKSPFEFAVSSVRALGGTYASVVESDAARNKGGKGGQLAGIKPPKGGGYLYMNTSSLVGEVGTMGQPLFQYQAPTGYPEESQKWVSSGALISRMNFALALTGGKLGDVSLPASNAVLTGSPNPNAFIDRFAEQVLHGSIAPATRATLLKQISDTPDTRSVAMTAPVDANITQRMAALLLGSPEFQRH